MPDRLELCPLRLRASFATWKSAIVPLVFKFGILRCRPTGWHDMWILCFLLINRNTSFRQSYFHIPI